jgi:hypothetical protein
MATPPSSNSPPTPPTPDVVLALRGGNGPETRDGPQVTHTPQLAARELPPEWQWQRYLDLSG